MNIEEEIARFQSKRKVLDAIQWVLAVTVMGVVFWLLFTAQIWGAILWALIWLFFGGYPIKAWVIPFLMIPFYLLIGGRRPMLAQQDARKMMEGKMTPDEFMDKWG